MTRNTELFDRIAAQIEAHPELYDQGTFGERTECGTAHCIAGHAVVLSGGHRPRGRQLWNHVRIKRGPVMDIEECAAKLLGLGFFESLRLFRGSWIPPEGESVPDALRRIGRGGAI